MSRPWGWYGAERRKGWGGARAWVAWLRVPVLLVSCLLVIPQQALPHRPSLTGTLPPGPELRGIRLSFPKECAYGAKRFLHHHRQSDWQVL